LILVRKTGASTQPELAIGAVVDGGQPIIVRNEYIMGAGSPTARIRSWLKSEPRGTRMEVKSRIDPGELAPGSAVRCDNK
jgi:predicted phosphoribosyltransferase